MGDPIFPKIWFHGTKDTETALKILRNGFREGTWFAAHLEDAIEFGGEFVFYVDAQFQTRKWQVCSANSVTKTAILKVVKFSRTYPFGDSGEYAATVEMKRKKKKAPIGPPDFPMSSNMAKSGLWGHVTRKD